MTRRISLTLMVYEGPMARSYMGMLAGSGYRVERVIQLVQKRDPASRQLVFPWLPARPRQALARRIQEQRFNYWPRELWRRHVAACTAWQQALSDRYQFPMSAYRWLREACDPLEVADCVDPVFVDGYKDPELARYLATLPLRTSILFTGGGLLPAALFEVSNCRFIHIHPGLLPNVRGADGMLWSRLLRGRLAASAFYMEAGLDTGEVIVAKEFLALVAPASFGKLDPATQYRMLYSYVDPMLRAVLLRDLLLANSDADLFALPVTRQDASSGTTFNFMNDRLKRLAFQRLLDDGGGETLHG